MFELDLSQSPGGCFHITTRTYVYYWFGSLIVGSTPAKFGHSIRIHSDPSGGSFQHYTHLLLDCFLDMSTGRHQPGSAPHRRRRRALLACIVGCSFRRKIGIKVQVPLTDARWCGRPHQPMQAATLYPSPSLFLSLMWILDIAYLCTAPLMQKSYYPA